MYLDFHRPTSISHSTGTDQGVSHILHAFNLPQKHLEHFVLIKKTRQVVEIHAIVSDNKTWSTMYGIIILHHYLGSESN